MSSSIICKLIASINNLKVEILEKLEELLKEFYPLDVEVMNVKENAPKTSGTASLSKPCFPIAVGTFDPPVSSVKTSTEARNQNVASFLDDILSPTKENFSRSPVKVNICTYCKILYCYCYAMTDEI
jgi:hypothetical protein